MYVYNSVLSVLPNKQKWKMLDIIQLCVVSCILFYMGIS